MALKVLFLSSISCTIEITGKSPYYTKLPYDVYLNGEKIITAGIKNCFSIYDLNANTDYLLEVKDEKEIKSIKFKTQNTSYILNVKRFNAQGDGKTDDTLAIQTAIMACPKDGVVFIPAGTYLVKSIFLKSNLNLYLSKGAKLLATTNRNELGILPGVIRNDESEFLLGSWEGNPLDIFTSVITGIDVHNINIMGEGIVDGDAHNSDWWINFKKRRGAFRPRGIFLNNCSKITMQGITVQNTASWTVHPYYSDKINFYDMKINNPKDSPNTDGLNPESCNDLKIIGIHFSVGDDCIALKAGKIYMAKNHWRPSSNITIRNCLMEEGHGAIVIGSEMSGGINNVNVSRCIFKKTDRGLRIKTRRGRGEKAVINNISFENIYMDQVLNALVVNMFYFCDPDGKCEYVYSKKPLKVDERTPHLGFLKFKNMKCYNTEISAGFFYGLPEAPIEAISLENIDVTYSNNNLKGQPAMMSHIPDVSKLGFYFNNVNRVSIKNVSIKGQIGDPFIFENVNNIEK